MRQLYLARYPSSEISLPSSASDLQRGLPHTSNGFVFAFELDCPATKKTKTNACISYSIVKRNRILLMTTFNT